MSCAFYSLPGERPCSKLVPAGGVSRLPCHTIILPATILLTTGTWLDPVSKVLRPAGTAICRSGNYLRTSWNLQAQSATQESLEREIVAEQEVGGVPNASVRG